VGDVVDTILDQWRRQRPDLDVTSMAVTVRAARLVALLERSLEDDFAGHGLAAWEFEVLAALRRTGAPFILTVGRLQGATMITSGTLTHRIVRLEKRGLITRSKTLTGRGLTVTLTPDGRTLVDQAINSRLAHERDLLATLSTPEQRQLAALLRKLLTSLEDQ
jgi:DNA-binding MarR family transcriptional regulator